MLLSDVVLDIPTKSLDTAYTYAVPADLSQEVQIGCALSVPFGHRLAVGFAISVYEGEAPEKVKDINAVLSRPYFNELGARCAQFIASRYVSPLSSAIRLFTPPGGIPKASRDALGKWHIEKPAVGEIDDRWVVRGDAFDSFSPKKNAIKQIAILDALTQGDIRVAELTYLYGNVTSSLRALEKRNVISIEHRRRMRTEAYEEGGSKEFYSKGRPKNLTKSQIEALSVIEDARKSCAGHTVLIDGITGSGKTEVYLRAIESVRSAGKSAIVLVPEISLTPQTLARFRGRFGDDVALIHSRMSQGERFDQWDAIRNGEAHIVIGARSALFTPLDNIGLIVIDEEHETTYKQESSPRYVSRDVASWIVKQVKGVLVLGSATPSIESLYMSHIDPTWHTVSMPERANGRPLPEIEIVDMTKDFSQGKRSIFSHRLATAIKDELVAGHKVILLLNQRGFAKFLLCHDCGFVPECSSCSTTLTYHELGNKLVCHHCGAQIAAPPVCPSCSSPYLKKYGVGTQRVEAELRDLLDAELGLLPEIVLPTDSDRRHAFGNDCSNDLKSDAQNSSDTPPNTGALIPIIRMDADTTSKKGSHQKLLEEFASSPRAVLLGTQMIAKGLDFDEVTLVGVINADTQLHLPDFRAAERTFDLIEQVAGRSGRGGLVGRVLVQTFEAQSVAIVAASHYDREMFLRSELPKRKVLGFPPFVRMANVLAWGKNEKAVRSVIFSLRDKIKTALERAGLLSVESPGEWVLMDPTPCAFERIRDNYRWHLIVKCPPSKDISSPLSGVFRNQSSVDGVNIAIDVDPVDLL